MIEQPEVPMSKEYVMIANLTQLLNEAHDRLEAEKQKTAQLHALIKRARQESELMVINGEAKVIVPYWFMKDENGG